MTAKHSANLRRFSEMTAKCAILDLFGNRSFPHRSNIPLSEHQDSKENINSSKASRFLHRTMCRIFEEYENERTTETRNKFAEDLLDKVR